MFEHSNHFLLHGSINNINIYLFISDFIDLISKYYPSDGYEFNKYNNVHYFTMRE